MLSRTHKRFDWPALAALLATAAPDSIGSSNPYSGQLRSYSPELGISGLRGRVRAKVAGATGA